MYFGSNIAFLGAGFASLIVSVSYIGKLFSIFGLNFGPDTTELFRFYSEKRLVNAL